MSHDLVLHMFLRSHYNEKARWGLDWKGLVHRRKTYLPGPHAGPIRRLSGATEVPILEVDGEMTVGSAAILEKLEALEPSRPLYPDDPKLRERALEIQRYFDDEVGPAVRTALFSILIDEPATVCSIFADDRSPLVQALYRAALPLVRGPMRKAFRVDDEAHIAHCFDVTQQAFDFLAKNIGPSGQLVGDTFSVADLTCAALLTLAVGVDHPDMKASVAMPERIEAFRERWRRNEAAAWIDTQYREHRPASCAT